MSHLNLTSQTSPRNHPAYVDAVRRSLNRYRDAVNRHRLHQIVPRHDDLLVPSLHDAVRRVAFHHNANADRLHCRCDRPRAHLAHPRVDRRERHTRRFEQRVPRWRAPLRVRSAICCVARVL